MHRVLDAADAQHPHGRGSRDRRPQRLRQVDAAESRQRHRPRRQRRGGDRRPDRTSMREPERTLFRRAHLGFVYQFFNLIPTLDVEENVRLALELNGSPRRRGPRAQRRRARRGRPGRPAAQRRRPAVGRRAAAGGDRARAGARAGCCWPMSRPAISTRRLLAGPARAPVPDQIARHDARRRHARRLGWRAVPTGYLELRDGKLIAAKLRSDADSAADAAAEPHRCYTAELDPAPPYDLCGRQPAAFPAATRRNSRWRSSRWRPGWRRSWR